MGPLQDAIAAAEAQRQAEHQAAVEQQARDQAAYDAQVRASLDRQANRTWQ